MAWQDELNHSITTAEQLCRLLKLPAAEQERYEQIISRFPMMITPYYFSLIDPNDPNDPIARMCIPSEAELSPEGSFDTSGEAGNTKQEGVQHKYRQTALILSTNVCAMYCRHCFRKRLVGLSDMNPNAIIGRYLAEFCEIPTLDLIRFGSRVPVTFPQRIYEDQELLDLFAAYARRKPIYLITQFNHPREITPESIRAVREFQARGVQVRNQTVLLRGVNDDSETLGTLLLALTRIEVVPYYIFQCRPVTGVKGRFQVPLREGVRLVDDAKAMQNGIGKGVRYAMSHPRGKIEILGEPETGTMLFKFHQNKEEADSARIFTARITDSTTWLDDKLEAI